MKLYDYIYKNIHMDSDDAKGLMIFIIIAAIIFSAGFFMGFKTDKKKAKKEKETAVILYEPKDTLNLPNTLDTNLIDSFNGLCGHQTKIVKNDDNSYSIIIKEKEHVYLSIDFECEN
jgi:hypothetical protein